MSTAEERGALGKRFHDLPTTTDNQNLSWEAMARHVLPPVLPEEEPNEKKPLFWWWLAGTALLAFGLTVYWLSETEEAIPEPAVVAVITSSMTDEVKMDASITVTPESLPAKTNKSLTATPKKNTRTETIFQPVLPVRPTAKTEDDLGGEETFSRSAELNKTTQVNETFQIDETIQVTETARPSYLVTVVAPLEIIPLLEPNSEIESSPIITLPEDVERKKGALVLMAGITDFQSRYEGDVPWLGNEQNQLSGQLSVRYERAVGLKWFVSGGIDVREYRFRTAFENEDSDARIFQPGTVDTIFRNLTTGEERIVTTDTVSGTRIRRFINDNSVIELGLPLLVGRRWTMGKHEFSVAAGPRMGLLVNRNGRTLVETNTVSDLETAPQFGQVIRWSARLEAGYAFRVTSGVSILGNLGGESALSDWSKTTDLKQRPTLLSGQVGLRFSLK